MTNESVSPTTYSKENQPKLIELKPFKQSYGLCVPASFKMVMDFYGEVHPEKYWAEKVGKWFINTDINEKEFGYFDDDLLELAKGMGFDGLCKDNASIDEVKEYIEKGIPVIVNWSSPEEGAHFSVIVGFGGDKIFLADPHFGVVKKHDTSWFLKRWSDHGLVSKDYPANDPGWVHRICVVYPKGK